MFNFNFYFNSTSIITNGSLYLAPSNFTSITILYKHHNILLASLHYIAPKQDGIALKKTFQATHGEEAFIWGIQIKGIVVAKMTKQQQYISFGHPKLGSLKKEYFSRHVLEYSPQEP